MVNEWPRLSLCDANVRLIDCDHRTPPPSDFGYPYVAIPQIRNGRIDLSDARRITPEHFAEWTKKAVPSPYDVVLSRRCNPGETAFVETGMEFALGQNLVLLRADGSRIHPPFLRWLVRGPEWWEQISKFLNVGAVFDSLKCADIPKFRLCLPPMHEQYAIASMLGALDDKIDLNRRMNETLETMARAIFKDWFVDFGPTRAKREGSERYLASEIWSLFPDRYDEEKPKGWLLGRLDDLIVLQRGFDLPTAIRTPGKYAVIAASGINGSHNEFMVRGPGVTTGRSGVLGQVFFVHEDFWPLNTSLWVKEFRSSSPVISRQLDEVLQGVRVQRLAASQSIELARVV